MTGSSRVLLPGRGFLLSALLVAVVGGCARQGAELEPTPLPPDEPDPIELPAAAVFDEPRWESPVRAPDPALLDAAEERIAEGRYRGAETLFGRYLDLGRNGEGEGAAAMPEAPEADRALWGLAMLHLLPDSPLHDRDEALALLDRLIEDHPRSARTVQARWIRGLLTELAQVRAQADQQEELLRQLTETVEQLKRIDLNRRPTGGATTGGDTIPPGR